MIPAPELGHALRASVRRGAAGDAVRLGLHPVRCALYALRRRWRRPAAYVPAAPTERGVAALPEGLGDAASLLARRWYHAAPPAAAEGFRAAGARRLAWPSAHPPTFADVQDAHAWHRLYWLAEGGYDATRAAQLDRWLAGPVSAEAAHPYARSERIVVTAEVLAARGDTLPAATRDALAARAREDARWLADHPERHLGVQNHLLNNARALCCAARLFPADPDAARWRRVARALWDEFWPPLVLDDGVFAEQSSHYHVLLTRTLLDYLADAADAGRALPDGMTERALAMCAVTDDLVRPDGSLPLFGDISPDQPTAWLRGLPAACARAGLLAAAPRDAEGGYAAGAGAPARAEHGQAGPGPLRERARTGRDGDTGEWQATLRPCGGLLVARAPAAGLELVAHGDPRAAVACHGDSGRGSFELWARGRRVVVDGGMPTYEGGEARRHFRSAAGQNVVALDGVGPVVLPEAAGDLPPWYVTGAAGGAWDDGDGWARFTWRGFGRLRPGLVWVRTWTWRGTRVLVEDRLAADGMGDPHAHASPDVRVDARVHFGEPGWRARGDRSFASEAAHVDVDAPATLRAGLDAMSHATDYGVLVAGQGLRLEGRVPLPARWALTFDLAAGA